MKKSLDGRVAIVTGAGSGLGRAHALALAQQGARVVVNDVAGNHAGSPGHAVVEEIRRCGGDAIADGGDVTDAARMEAMAARAIDRWGRIDILVNNAGTAWGAPAEDYPLDGWNKVIDLNVTGLFLLTQAVARDAFLKQGKGAVVNVASIEGLQGHHPDRLGTIAYNTAKGAVINMTRALAAEWGPRNIRVNALAPGFFPSKLAAAALAEHGEEILRQTPLGKLGGDTDLMGAALLLASDAGGHITGQTLVIDGGATII